MLHPYPSSPIHLYFDFDPLMAFLSLDPDLNHLDKYKRRCEEYHSSDKKSLPRLARKSHGFTRDDTRFIGTRYISNKSFGSRRKRVRSVNMIPTWRHRAI